MSFCVIFIKFAIQTGYVFEIYAWHTLKSPFSQTNILAHYAINIP